ncbi:uncharacterized protein MELLADRAFT_106114 [Melampsora larici-populina 98AG31]|uniref:Secreted protein n=1 Tax=Melampsora larici-populina (strain 98AG31 / pathotype 3-4-7) TaxID=747676 RepID=F4RKF8_MELLP|nr:uncharacterized protein MELLADRAFT_106114 [Melampsora larici-populina 98AG31]EGG07189.1 hypothetical protein MELLADRAFT_106114 [Melampsora larici-populina 98AG31]
MIVFFPVMIIGAGAGLGTLVGEGGGVGSAGGSISDGGVGPGDDAEASGLDETRTGETGDRGYESPDLASRYVACLRGGVVLIDGSGTTVGVDLSWDCRGEWMEPLKGIRTLGYCGEGGVDESSCDGSGIGSEL